ncbi:hypothetical protein CEXT_546511 [Caerostris extrusa]|uniref:Uncharacterized protein n=1 Tax=Caerostris extrusa TaxID=172846 RepID=A0AAV4UHJ5_CAEEX|nr:hypothetical protein CEXT_546511 [Caerostris extrusa]
MQRNGNFSEYSEQILKYKSIAGPNRQNSESEVGSGKDLLSCIKKRNSSAKQTVCFSRFKEARESEDRYVLKIIIKISDSTSERICLCIHFVTRG